MSQQVDDGSLKRLLELQIEDTALKRLEERRASLPEAARLVRVKDLLAELTADLEIAEKQRDEISREQNRLEGEIGLVDEKITREEQRMYSGGVSNPKELSALQAEVESLKRRRAGLEDELLEVMVQKDQAVATAETLAAEKSEAASEELELSAMVDSLTREIEAEAQTHRSRRTEIELGLPRDLVKLYDQLRATKGGVGAAALEAGTCQGCHTKLPAKEAERIRAERGLQRCDNCRRILVVV